MRPQRRRISADVPLLLVTPNGYQNVLATFSYANWDPYAVIVFFHLEYGPLVVWTFSRDLLHRAINCKRTATGRGDIRITKGHLEIFADGQSQPPVSRPALCIDLRSPFGQAVFWAFRAPIADFLVRTYTIVRRGRESDFSDIDAELAGLKEFPELAPSPFSLPPPCKSAGAARRVLRPSALQSLAL